MSDRTAKIVAPTMDRLIEQEAARAVEEIQSRTSVLTPTLVKGAIEKRLRAYLGPGAVLPKVSVGLRRREYGGGYDVEITPGDVPGIAVKKP